MDVRNAQKKRKILIVLLGVALIVILLLFFLFRWKETPFLKRITGSLPIGERVQAPKERGEREQQGTEKVEKEGERARRKPAPRLRQITDFPTGGFVGFQRIHPEIVKDIVVNAKGEKQEITREVQVEDDLVRYSDIEKGNVFESILDPYGIKEELLVENFIPNVEHAFFSPDGKHVVFQYWNKAERTAETYFGKIFKKQPNVQPCPYQFKDVEIGDEGDYVINLHKFLNEDPRTRVSLSGINSPGNEGNVVVPETITAIKNFQAIYGLTVDGKIGGDTEKKMKEICYARQLEKAKEELAKEKTQYDMEGQFLPKGIVAVAFSPDRKQLFTLEKVKDGSVGLVTNFDDGTKKTVFKSPFSEWIAQWNSDRNIQITTKASYLTDSYTYGLDPTTGRYHKTLPQDHGLTTLASPDNKKVFIHVVRDGKTKNYIFFKDEDKEIVLTDVHTFPEKCVWTSDSALLYCFVPNNLEKDGEYPDRWYQGLELFSDQLWKIDGNTTREELVSDIPSEYNKNLDAWKVGIDPKSHYLYFINKGTETLWSYRLYDAEGE